MKGIHNVLITGGAGFIGSNTALALISKGYNVTVLDNLSEQVHGPDPHKSFLYNSVKDEVSFIKGDVRNRADWEKALENQDAVIHLAAETGTGQSMYQIHKYIDVNVGGTAMMFDLLTNTKHSVQKIVIASSRAVYGEGRYYCNKDGVVYPGIRKESDLRQGKFECKCPACNGEVSLMATHEDSKIDPQSVYGVSKYHQEQLTMVTAKSMGIKAVAFRYQNVYGPGQSLSNPYTGILSIFSTQIKNNNPLHIFEDGLESRDFVYISDVVNATIAGLENDSAGSNVFNVGSGLPVPVYDIGMKLIELYKSQVQVIKSGNYRLGDIRHNFADMTEIQTELGFKPVIQFEAGLEKYVSWVNSQQVQEDKYEQSIRELKEKGLFK